MGHGTLNGDRVGEYVIRDEHEDGTLVLAPESAMQASLRRRGARQATGEQFDTWVAENEPLLPADGEG